MELIQIIAIVFALFALSRAALRLRDKQINFVQFMFWGMIWVMVIVVAFVPKITFFFSNLLGIERGIDFAVYISIILLFYLMFRLYVKLDKIEEDMTKIVRKIAIRKK